ncbi:MAG: hypothetical protein LBE91_06295 [Tannerella sp.]|jgi:hypothetical protein|nr:hypothetical protein [Tannerella sp.]
MNEEIDLKYDDDEAVRFIRNYLPAEIGTKFSDDDINYIIDLVYEFYESKGFLDGEDGDDDREIDFNEDELTAFVVKNALTDEVGKFEADEISHIVQGEMAYCESIGMFD